MAKSLMLQAVADKISLAAANAGTPMAQAKADMLKSQLITQHAPSWYEMTMRQAMYNRLQNMNAEQGAHADPVQNFSKEAAMQIRMNPQIPESEKENYFKELDEWQKTELARKSFHDSMDHMQKLFAAGQLDPFSADKRATYVNALAGKITQINEKRFNWEASKNLAQGIFDTAWTSKGGHEEKLRKGDELFNGMTPTPRLDSMGIYPPKTAADRASGSQRQAIDWAKQNINSPNELQKNAALKVLQKFGISFGR
jgi:hypothetical protein